jgi:hypothetical protein
MKTTRHDIIYDDGTYVVHTRGEQNIWKQGEVGVAYDALWVKFPNLGDIFLSQLWYLWCD